MLIAITAVMCVVCIAVAESVPGIGTTVGILAALVTLLGLLVRELRTNRQMTIDQMNEQRESDRAEIHRQQSEIERQQRELEAIRNEHNECRRENRECERKIQILIHVLHDNHIEVPVSIHTSDD